jgi:hypothetical protein
MNFGIHLGSELVRRLDAAARESGKIRNALVREAVGEWLERRRTKTWPVSVTNFRGTRPLARFEDSRQELRRPKPPFHALSA